MPQDPQLDLNLPQPPGVENVEEYRFEPIKGYPMLNWKEKRPLSNTQYYYAVKQGRQSKKLQDLWIQRGLGG